MTMTTATEVKKKEAFTFEDQDHLSGTLKSLNALRKNKHFCDVVLQIGAHEIHAHRPVLACASPYLFDLFSIDGEGSHEFRFKLNGGFEKDSFERLVNYAYTSRLEVPADQVKTVYMAANRLKMDKVARKCGEYLVGQLNPENCIGIRSMPGLCNDPDLCTMVDAYIQQELELVAKNKEIHALPRIQVEVVRYNQSDMEVVQGHHLCNMVLDWIKHQLENEDIAVNSITEKVHMLFVNADHSLRDCNEIETGDAKDSEIVQDYKKKSKKFAVPPSGKSKKKSTAVPAKPRQLLYSRSTSDSSICSEGGIDVQWRLVGHMSVGDYSLMAVVVMNNKLCMLSVCQRLHQVPLGSPQPSPLTANEDPDDYCLLPPMASGRCAVGTAELDGKLLVCGGYDRAECLRSVQLYNPKSNCWQTFESMRNARGRFDITVADSKVFAVGGCDGANDLASVECFDGEHQKWHMLPPLHLARSNAGVCTLDGKIYCIGGVSNGRVGTKRCDVFDPQLGAWVEIAPLLTGRSQAGVCAFNGSVYAVGGCDQWNCLSTVEKYDAESNVWNYIAPLSTARRGCGAAGHDGKIYAVGGSDGSRSLCSVEVYSLETNTWTGGPNLTSCRANVGVAVVDGKLYAVGGFTGKTFLNTIENLDPQTNEWTTFTLHNPQENGSSVKHNGSSAAHNGSTVDHNGSPPESNALPPLQLNGFSEKLKCLAKEQQNGSEEQNCFVAELIGFPTEHNGHA